MLSPDCPDAQLIHEICPSDCFIIFHRFHLLVTSETFMVLGVTLGWSTFRYYFLALVGDFYFRINNPPPKGCRIERADPGTPGIPYSPGPPMGRQNGKSHLVHYRAGSQRIPCPRPQAGSKTIKKEPAISASSAPPGRLERPTYGFEVFELFVYPVDMGLYCLNSPYLGVGFVNCVYLFHNFHVICTKLHQQ